MKREIDKILKPGETVELVVYPQWRWLTQVNIISVLVAVLLFFVVGNVSISLVQGDMQADHISLLLALLPFWAAAIGLAISPFWRRKRVMRTLYVVTNRRAIVVQPSPFLLKPELRTWPLNDELIKSVYADADGTGDIIFDYRKVHTKHGFRDEPEGFLNVPQVQTVYAALQAQMGGAASAPAPQVLPVSDSPLDKKKKSLATCIMGAVFGGVGGLFFAVGLLIYLQQQEVLQNGIKTEAVVVKLQRSTNSDGDVSYYPVVQFTATDGKQHTVRGTWSNNKVRKGDKLNIFYLPQCPEDFEIEGHSDFLLPYAFMGMGGSSFLIGVGYLVYGLRLRKK